MRYECAGFEVTPEMEAAEAPPSPAWKRSLELNARRRRN
jgi:hypothetical protein